MTPTLSCAVMAHPKREAMVAELVEQLDRPAKVVWDTINDRHDTGIRAMLAYDPACSHHVVLQDDIIPSRDLIAGAERALRWIPPDVPASLYVGRVRPFSRAVESATREAGDAASWIVMAGVYWGPAIIVPTAVIPEMAEWFRTSRVTNYDRRISTWFQKRRVQCWYTWPSLVEHRGLESLVYPRGNRRLSGPRLACRFLGAGLSALDVDWSGPVVHMSGTDQMDRARQRHAKRAAARK